MVYNTNTAETMDLLLAISDNPKQLQPVDVAFVEEKIARSTTLSTLELEKLERIKGEWKS